MSDKANLAVDGKELTLYFHIADGLATPCYYCQKPGREQLVVLERVEKTSGAVSPRTKLFRNAQAKLQHALLHRRGICERSDLCVEKYSDDKRASEEVVV